MMKYILLALSFVPLCFHVPYLIQAWNSSRLDKLDWIFYLLTIPAVIWAVRKEKMEKCDWYALLLLIPMLFVTATTFFHQINAIGIGAAVGVIFATVWLLGSWGIAYRILPCVMILLLGTPSSSYQLSLLVMCPVWMAWTLKFLTAVLCFIWIGCNKRFALRMKKGSLFFSAATLGSCLLLLHTAELYFEGKAFVPEFVTHPGDYWGRKLEPDENTKRFFITSTFNQYRYTRNNLDISVLAVRCGRNIHEIHPASHCLRTSQWTIHSEKILYLKENFAVTEIDSEKGSSRFLVWVWYSSDTFSTPGFLGFRKHFQSGGNYYTYQISVPVYDNNIEQSRAELLRFFELLQKEKRS